MPKPRLPLSSTAVLLPLLAACGADADAGPPSFAVRDSAGVRIAESRAPAWIDGEAWRVAAEPAMAIGLVDGPAAYQLDGVSGAFRLPDGRIVVADAGSAELRWFSPDGRHLASAGGQGGGPGEFERMGRIFRSGDSLVVTDHASDRITVFGADGEMRGVSTLERGEDGRRRLPVGVLGDGSLLLRRGFPLGDLKPGLATDSATLLRHDPATGEADELGTIHGSSRWLEMGSGIRVTSVPFSRRGRVVATADGYWYAPGGRREVEMHAPDGTLRRVVRWPGEARPVTDDDVEGYVRDMEANSSNPGWIPSLRGMLEEMPLPERMPPHGDLLPDAEGNLWVQAYAPAWEERNAWTVFDPEGRMLGDVDLPRRFRPTEIGADHVLGVATDDLGVERVLLFPLEKPASD